ncbi:MAG: hypothetical protein ABIP48_18915 [Planctomycetota bacterium]
MSWIAACKICQEPVTIPEGADRSESVCCPRCRAEFLSSEVPGEVGQEGGSAEPPHDVLPVEALFDETSEPETSELQGEPSEGKEEEEEPGLDLWVEQAEEFPEIDLSRGIETDSETGGLVAEAQEPAGQLEEETESEDAAEDSEGPNVASEDVVPEIATDEPEPSTHEPPEATPATPQHAESPRVRCPACEAEYGLSQMIVVSTGSRLGAAAAAAVAGATAHSATGESPGEGPMLDVWARADTVPQIDLGEAAGAQVVSAEPGAFDFARDDSEAADGSGSVAAARQERRRKQKSGLRTIMGPIFGGIAGLVIAYYLLNWIRGEAGNFMEIPLPGVPHTYKYSPEWFPGWMKPEADSEDVASEETADGGRRFLLDPGKHRRQPGREPRRLRDPTAVCRLVGLDDQAGRVTARPALTKSS